MEKTLKKALITGITGQDGSYLAEYLIGLGYEVHGTKRRSSSLNTSRIDHLIEKDVIRLHYADLSDASSIARLLEKIKPDEIYNLGAQSHVQVSFEVPESTSDIVALGALRLLDGIKETGIKTRFYQAGSSEMFGEVLETPQCETTPFNPQSPYAVGKVFAHNMTRVYRKSYNMFACNGILFNHESPRRGETFVTRKVTIGLSMIKLGLQKTLLLGNIDSKRDWGFAGDYVKGMHLMLQQEEPDDYVLATGETYSVRTFVEECGCNLGMDIVWDGKGLSEKGIDSNTGKIVIEIAAKYFRPAEVDLLLGDATKAKEKLGWKTNTNFKQLVQMMVESDLTLLRKGLK